MNNNSENVGATVSEGTIEIPTKVKVSSFRKIRCHIRRFFRDLHEAFVYFRSRRYIGKLKPGILLMAEIKVFDRPEMYVGTMDKIKFFRKFEIDMHTLEPITFPGDDSGKTGKTACIGFSSKRQKWYGWSHRAIYGFKIGDEVHKGDVVNSTGWTPEYLKKHPEKDLSLPVGFKAETLDDCKRMAIAFAESVS